jgi:hypothetical protein
MANQLNGQGAFDRAVTKIEQVLGMTVMNTEAAAYGAQTESALRCETGASPAGPSQRIHAAERPA